MKLKDKLKQIAHFYGCKVRFIKVKDEAEVDLEKGIIYCDKDLEENMLISLFFHELAHIHNKISKRYYDYHYDIIGSTFFKTAYKAEQYTDKLGKELCEIWFSEIKYRGFYTDTRVSKRWFEDNYLKYFRR